MFREGIKSFEVYTEQTANMMAKAGVPGSSAPRGGSSLTMFHQIMYFLVLQEEMKADVDSLTSAASKNINQTNPLRSSNFFPSLLPEEEIQKVIFDEQYLDYISKKSGGENSQPGGSHKASDIYITGAGDVVDNTAAAESGNIMPGGAIAVDVNQSRESGAGSMGAVSNLPNTSLQAAAAMAKESHLPHSRFANLAATEKERKL